MSTLRPFEAAARHRSFTKAAAEIAVTQAAVSKQVRMLEAFLGCKLFTRRGREIAINDEGRILYRAVAQGLATIADGIDKVRRDRRPSRISIAMRLAFASQFMAPRLNALRKECDGIDLNIVSTEGNPSFLLDQVDMAIVLGHEPQPDIVEDWLITEEIFPVCSPAYAERHPELQTAGDIPGQTLIHLDHDHWAQLSWSPVDWPALLRGLGVGGPGIGGPGADTQALLAGWSVNSHEMLMSAAASGVGLAVGWKHLCKELLDRKLLIRPIANSYRIDRKHYLLTHNRIAEDPAIQRLRQWFLRETECFRQS